MRTGYWSKMVGQSVILGPHIGKQGRVNKMGGGGGGVMDNSHIFRKGGDIINVHGWLKNPEIGVYPRPTIRYRGVYLYYNVQKIF